MDISSEERGVPSLSSGGIMDVASPAPPNTNTNATTPTATATAPENEDGAPPTSAISTAPTAADDTPIVDVDDPSPYAPSPFDVYDDVDDEVYDDDKKRDRADDEALGTSSPALPHPHSYSSSRAAAAVDSSTSASSPPPMPGAYAVPGIHRGAVGLSDDDDGGGAIGAIVAHGDAYYVEPEEDGDDDGGGDDDSGGGDGNGQSRTTTSTIIGGGGYGGGDDDANHDAMTGGLLLSSTVQHVVPEATLVRDDESLIYVATITPRWHQQKQTKSMFGVLCVSLFAISIGLGFGLSGRSSSNDDAGGANSTTAIVPDLTDVICNGTECALKDWAPCVSSDECDCGCCSGEYSGGVLACTPLDETLLLGGYQPTICVGTPKVPWPRCSISKENADTCDSGCCSGHFTGGNTNCTPIAGEELRNICLNPERTNCTNEYYCIGGWVQCNASGDCDSGCCSGSLSGGVPKCVPLDAPGYFPEICMIEGYSAGPVPATTPSPTPPCVVGACLGDWSECELSSDCANECCSSVYSGGVFKCTPLDPIGYNPEICTSADGGVTPTPTPVVCVDPDCLGDWSECTSSSECANGCCSDEYSGGIFKCTPLDPVGYNAKICNAA
ncbi:hypothetical protein ACHAXA_007967 [Cyclostephanos tholiformis]|uniref:Uncharacterized protein n=1 Tax=Cyclostephanos tholiformis TaxID=382380 RepID=A0ABD3R3V1_9STRA